MCKIEDEADTGNINYLKRADEGIFVPYPEYRCTRGGSNRAMGEGRQKRSKHRINKRVSIKGLSSTDELKHSPRSFGFYSS